MLSMAFSGLGASEKMEVCQAGHTGTDSEQYSCVSTDSEQYSCVTDFV